MWLGLLEGGGRGWGGAQGPEVGGRGGPGRGPGPAALHLVFRLFARAWGFEPGVWVGRRGAGVGACLPERGGLHPVGGCRVRSSSKGNERLVRSDSCRELNLLTYETILHQQ